MSTDQRKGGRKGGRKKERKGEKEKREKEKNLFKFFSHFKVVTKFCATL